MEYIAKNNTEVFTSKKKHSCYPTDFFLQNPFSIYLPDIMRLLYIVAWLPFYSMKKGARVKIILNIRITAAVNGGTGTVYS